MTRREFKRTSRSRRCWCGSTLRNPSIPLRHEFAKRLCRSFSPIRQRLKALMRLPHLLRHALKAREDLTHLRAPALPHRASGEHVQCEEGGADGERGDVDEGAEVAVALICVWGVVGGREGMEVGRDDVFRALKADVCESGRSASSRHGGRGLRTIVKLPLLLENRLPLLHKRKHRRRLGPHRPYHLLFLSLFFSLLLLILTLKLDGGVDFGKGVIAVVGLWRTREVSSKYGEEGAQGSAPCRPLLRRQQSYLVLQPTRYRLRRVALTQKGHQRRSRKER